MSTTAPYRIEERDTYDGQVLAATEQGWDGPLTAGEALGRFQRALRERSVGYDVGSPYRLVLLGPSRTVLPGRQRTAEERAVEVAAILADLFADPTFTEGPGL